MKEEKILGGIIKEIRQNKGISQERFAKITGLDRSYISHIETGKKSPTLSTILKIAVGLDIELSFLIKEMENRLKSGAEGSDAH
jgi:transcriptional regulator with XRE-family HTH domain